MERLSDRRLSPPPPSQPPLVDTHSQTLSLSLSNTAYGGTCAFLILRMHACMHACIHVSMYVYLYRQAYLYTDICARTHTHTYPSHVHVDAHEFELMCLYDRYTFLVDG